MSILLNKIKNFRHLAMAAKLVFFVVPPPNIRSLFFFHIVGNRLALMINKDDFVGFVGIDNFSYTLHTI